MARVEIWEVIADGSGRPVTGADVFVYNARTVVQATVYAAETGGTTMSQPIETVNGGIPGWVEEGEYDLAYSGVGISSGTRRFNALVGGNPELAANAITHIELAPDSVGSSEIQADSVGSSEIAPDAVTSNEIANNAVGSDEIATGAVGSGEIATGAVGSDEIATGAVGSDEIATGAVGSDEIATNAVTSTELADDAVDTAAIQNSAVTSDKVNLLITTRVPSADTEIGDPSSAVWTTVTGSSSLLTAGTWLVIATVTFETTVASGSSGFEYRFRGNLNGAPIVGIAKWSNQEGILGEHASITHQWFVSPPATQAFKLEAQCPAVFGTHTVLAAYSRWTGVKIA